MEGVETRFAHQAHQHRFTSLAQAMQGSVQGGLTAGGFEGAVDASLLLQVLSDVTVPRVQYLASAERSGQTQALGGDVHAGSSLDASQAGEHDQ
ncbi:hypothetical protein D3C80_1660920 [compost metagenome]